MFRISILGFRISRLSMPTSETPIDQKRAIMQNKPNLLDAQMSVSSALAKDYENKPRLRTQAKQTQSNPISKTAGLIK